MFHLSSLMLLREMAPWMGHRPRQTYERRWSGSGGDRVAIDATSAPPLIKKEAISFLPRAPLRGYRHSALPWAEVLRPFRPLTLNAPVSSNKNIDIISLPRRDRFVNFLPPRNPTFPLLPIQTFNPLFIASLDRG